MVLDEGYNWNATLVVEIEKDGATAQSSVLQFECELDENGTKVDEKLFQSL